MLEFLIEIYPLVSMINIPPKTAKFLVILQFKHEMKERSFKQNTPPSSAELYSNTELTIYVTVCL